MPYGGRTFGLARRRVIPSGLPDAPPTYPVNTVAPKFLDGAGNAVTTPVLGQPVFFDPGTWTGSPTSFSGQMYVGGVAFDVPQGWNAGDPAPSYLPLDQDVGSALRLGITANNGFSSPEALSTATSAVADIGTGGVITNAITAFSRTSVSGTVPMTWSLSFGSNVYEGYWLRANVYSDSAKTTLVQSVLHYITNADLQAGATIDLASDGLTDPTATQWLEMGVETTSPNSNFYSYTYPTAISPTDAVVAMTFSATDKDPSVTLSAGNLTMTWGGGGSNYGGVRANRRITAGAKVHAEFTINTAVSTTVGIADSAQAVGSDFQPELSSGGPATAHAATLNRFGQTDYNGVYTSGGSTFANGDLVVVEFDDTAKKVWWAVKPSGGSVSAWFPTGSPAAGTGGLSVAAMNGTEFFAAQVSFGGGCTANYAGPFTVTPSTGFGAA